MEPWKQELYHHGILGMRWGKRNGPPYPLSPGDHSASEKKAGWRKSLSERRSGRIEKKKERKTQSQNIDDNSRKESNRKKMIVAGATVVAATLAAYGAYKLYSNKKNAIQFMDNINDGKSYVDFIRKTSLRNLFESSDDSYEWYRESVISDLNRAKNKIDDISVPIKNPFLRKIPDYIKGRYTNAYELKEQLSNEVTQIFKDISDLDSSRQINILEKIKNEYDKIPKDKLSGIITDYGSDSSFKELDDITQELIRKNAKALGI